MTVFDPALLPLWHLVTRLGESQLVLPVAVLAAVVLLRLPGGGPLARLWMAMLAASVLLTLATKIAFIGWGWGSASLDFTGVSGHAMVATAVYPLLFGTIAAQWPRPGRAMTIGAGISLALLVGLSRLAVQAHSTSEVVAGLLLGGVVSAAGLCLVRPPPAALSAWIPAAIAGWLALTVLHAPASATHDLVTRLALELSGHDRPYTRAGMHRAQEHAGLRVGVQAVNAAVGVELGDTSIVPAGAPLRRP
jgi:membrane-associated phospholipid phosphatase